MKLWQFSNPHDHKYATASVRGSWEGSPARRVRPLIIEWEPGTDLIGDFTWPGFGSDIVITDRVGAILREARVAGFQLAPVEMTENSEPRKRRTKKPTVRLPYSGPQLWDLWVTNWIHIDPERSTVSTLLQRDGTVVYEVSGVQHIETHWNQQRMELVEQVQPRIEGQGLFVRHVRGIFRIEEFPGCIFCSNDVKEIVDAHALTNVSFLEMGDVLPD